MHPGSGGGANINPFSAQPPNINPFSQPPPSISPYNYEVQTTYVPHADHPVPSATSHPAPSQPQFGGAVPAVPQAQAPSTSANTFRIPFMNSTAVPSATGNIGKPAPGQQQPGQFNGQQQQQQHGGGAGGQPPQQPPNSNDTRPLLNQQRPQEDHTKYAFYNVRRYRPLFDVDTTEVLWRVGNSFIGAFRANFMRVTQEKPDLYGPFWIATTLVFVTAVAGNYAKYIDWKHMQLSPSPPSPPPPLPPVDAAGGEASTVPGDGPTPAAPTDDIINTQWFTDYNKLGASAGIFYGYVFVLSLLLWLVMRYMRADMRLANMFCVYGYAMTIFIPVSLVCIIPIQLMRWLLVMGATLISGLFLLMNLKERIMEAGAGKAVPMLIVVLALHCGLGLVLKLYFFKYG